jgi:quercetin dioxygenase-like cupin family protein
MSNFKKVADAFQFSADKMKKNGLFETARLLCDVYCFEPGQSQSAHAHAKEDKVYYVLEGKGVFQVGSEERDLSSGEMALAPAGQSHGVLNRSAERLKVLVFVAPKPAH